jgi:DNA polymerase
MPEQFNLFPREVLQSGSGAALRVLQDRARICQKCKLHESRTNVVFGVGCDIEPPLAFVGEGPGENEDLQGKPFVGRAGELLDRMIAAMGFKRESVYICNVVGCRPPGNRPPEPDEIAACKEFLVGQLRVVRPKVIVTLGATASQSLLKSTKKIGDLRGRWFVWEDIPVRATYHPAYLLRDARKKKDAWSDLQFVLQRLQMTLKHEHGHGQGDDGHGRSEGTSNDGQGSGHDGGTAPLPESTGAGRQPDHGAVPGDVRAPAGHEESAAEGQGEAPRGSKSGDGA